MASGRPDWYGSMSMHGKFGDLYKPVAVDTEGNLMSMMYGGPPGARHYIEVDAAGVMKANLALQDLDEMTVRVYYGAAKAVFNWHTVPVTTEDPLFTVNGKGTIYGGFFNIHNEPGHTGDTPKLLIDDQELVSLVWSTYYHRNINKPGMYPIYINQYNPTDGDIMGCISPGATFESKVELRYLNVHVTDPVTVYYSLMYAEIT